MSELGEFYEPAQINYEEIVPVYQEAFKTWPWFEVSKCADDQLPQRCLGGLSRLALGSACESCDRSVKEPAYTEQQLTKKFKQIASSRPTSWYLERMNESVALAAIAWTATPDTIAAEKYQDIPGMQDWLIDKLGTEPIVWLDEVFADKTLRESGNLRNFGAICEGLASRLDEQTIAFRTINPAMTRAAVRDFAGRAKEADPPDRRDFVIIEKGDLR